MWNHHGSRHPVHISWKLEGLQVSHCCSVQRGLGPSTLCNPYFHFGQINHTPKFLCKFPVSKFPAFKGDNGFCVFDSNASAYSVSNKELWGGTPEAAKLKGELRWQWHSDPSQYLGVPHFGHCAPQEAGDIECKGGNKANSGATGCSLKDKDFFGRLGGSVS